jgi:hypothetical protein
MRDDEPGSSRVRARSSSRTRSRGMTETEEPFAESGLLGRTYSLRQQAMIEQECAIPPVPPIKPLVDLSGQKHHVPERQGHGVPLDRVPAGGLIAAATNKDQSFEVNNSHGTALTSQRGRSGTMRRSEDELANIFRDESQRGRTGTMSKASQDAFTGGLLSQASEGQGGRRQGKGIQSGDRDANAPLLDMQESSTYIPGSLLSRVERNEDKGPIVQREKLYEVNTRTGEAF